MYLYGYIYLDTYIVLVVGRFRSTWNESESISLHFFVGNEGIYSMSDGNMKSHNFQ